MRPFTIRVFFGSLFLTLGTRYGYTEVLIDAAPFALWQLLVESLREMKLSSFTTHTNGGYTILIEPQYIQLARSVLYP